MNDSTDEGMTRRDRDDLARAARLRAKVAKADAARRKAQLLAEFEEQLDRRYDFDEDKVWRAAMEAATQAVDIAQKLVDQRCEELGIPKAFRPEVGGVHWYNRGQNAVKERRSELRRLATVRLDAMEKEAKAAIEARSAEIEAEILAGGLETDEARRFLEAMPTSAALMPPLDLKTINALRAESERNRRPWALPSGDDMDDEDDESVSEGAY